MRRSTACFAVIVACGRTPSEPKPQDPTAPDAGASGEAALPSPRAVEPSGPEVWTGTFSSARAAYFIPRDGDVPNAKDWDGVKQRVDDGGVGLGEGSMTLRIDRATGRVSGSIEAPVGPAQVSGMLSGDAGVYASVSRTLATDNGLTGTLAARGAGAALEGSMRLSEWNAVGVRTATFTLRRAP